MERIQEDCEGVCIEIDDILVHGKDNVEHDEHLEKVLRKLEDTGITLNVNKLVRKKLGYLVNSKGIKADPKKVCAIFKMSSPSNV